MEKITKNDLVALSPTTATSDYEEYRFILTSANGEFPVLVRIPSVETGKLLVLYNGAIQRSKAPDGLVFQRSSWLDELSAAVVQFADPTLVKHNRLQIGWAQLSPESWAIDEFFQILNRIRSVFSLPDSTSTIHYGSSAGGFQASCMACFDEGSRAIVNNPQLDWSRYDERFVSSLLRDVFSGKILEEIRSEEPWRVNVVELFQHRSYVPELDIFTNLASDGDYGQQLIPALESLRNYDDLNRAPRVSFTTYSDPNLGHNPLPKAVTLRLLNDALRGNH